MAFANLNQFHLSNVCTLSVILEKNLKMPEWRAGQHESACLMIRAFFTSR